MRQRIQKSGSPACSPGLHSPAVTGDTGNDRAGTPQDDPLEQAKEYGADVAGGLAGVGVGLLVAGPVGAAIGAVAAPAVRRAVGEVLSRHLGQRGAERIGATLIFASQAFSERQERGDTIRDDGFFAEDVDGRSAGEEVAEAVLTAAEREYEERKLPFLGRLLANLAFESEYGRGQANFFVRTARELSYEQLVLLSFFGFRDRGRYRVPETDYRGGGEFTQELIGLLHETFDLFSRGLLVLPNDTLLGLSDVNPGRLTTLAGGEALYILMELHRIPEEDRERVARAFRSGYTPAASK
jgi:hypothetical protein